MAHGSTPGASSVHILDDASTRGAASQVGSCWLQTRPDPCAIVIFGASGDLTARKLFPALIRLRTVGGLPDDVAIIGAARTSMDSDAFRERMRESLEEAGLLDRAFWREFAGRLFYRPLSYDSADDYAALAGVLEEAEARFKTQGNRIFYLATPPTLYETVAEHLGQAGLARPKDGRWTRIVVEKPFGRDLPSARELDKVLHRSFSEDQVFRIDHYLAKETIQNVLMFRFANLFFEPLWNRNYIHHVSIVAGESLGVEHRAGYYEQSGVLRDMFQNHMMQLLALAAMEPPATFSADLVRDEKAKVYHSLRPFDPSRVSRDLVLGQYAAGTVGGRPAPAYREEQDVASGSLTPTFATLRVHIDNWRWQGVPFFLTSGKRLARKLTRIIIQFKGVAHSLFRRSLGEYVTANRLVMETYPSESITLAIHVKGPGTKLCLRNVDLGFDFSHEFEGSPLEAYEKVLLDCMLGDHMLFLRQDAVELSWGFLTPVLELCENRESLEQLIKPYPAGTWGPAEVLGVHPGYRKDLEERLA